MRLVKSPEGGVLGIYTETGYDIARRHIEEPYWKDLVFGFRRMTEAELSQFEGYTFGYVYTNVMAECKKYLPWIKQRFETLGGRCIQRKVENLSELYGEYDIVVNCTGVGAKELVNDAEVHSIKGQLIRVAAPWVKHWVLADDDDLYIIVSADSVALGGTHQTDVMRRHIDQDERRRIWEGCCRLMPSLQRAKVLEEWAGLRPGRTAIRLEAELRDLGNGKTLPVVHNYGHGGSGVTLHWGCAGDTVRLVQGLITSKSTPSTIGGSKM
jgi:glycine/D-amino acid oxidase-like deaminating enzyme